jgi:SPP1 family predicted phage head-tail adaptor
MQIGKLDQVIGLESPIETNTRGQVVKSFITQGDVWGYVISQKGSEAFEAARLNASSTIRVQIRYRTDITTEWRVDWQGSKYYIESLDKTARRDGYLWFTAKIMGAT